MNPCDWPTARDRARQFTRELPWDSRACEDAIGGVLVEPLKTLTDIPTCDLAAVDGWAVAGPGPWTVRRPQARDLMAGTDYHEKLLEAPLSDGQAASVDAGDPVGLGATAVVPKRRGHIHGDTLQARESALEGRNWAEPGSGIRPRGIDAGVGHTLLPAGENVTPAVAGLAAMAGHDELTVIPMPTVAIVRVGTEMLDWGIPRHGLDRDSVTPALQGWIRDQRCQVTERRHVTEGETELIDTIEASGADIVVTTGPHTRSAVGRVLVGMGASVLVDGVVCRPGAGMLLAELPDGRPLLHCGGHASDALATLVTLLAPIVATLMHQPDPAAEFRIDTNVFGDRKAAMLLPVAISAGRRPSLSIVRPGGPGGLLALSSADALAVIGTEGARQSDLVTTLPLKV